MARRRLVWHVGPADPGTTFLDEALAARGSELAERGVHLPVGDWPEVERQVWEHKGTSLLSTPALARADRATADLRLTGMRDVEVHVVLAVRDLPTQVYAAWQAGIQQGSTTGLEVYAARVLDRSRSHWQAEDFWTGRDLDVLLDRWTSTLPPERVHVLGATGEAALWDGLLAVAGIDDVPCPTDRVDPTYVAALDQARVAQVLTGWDQRIADAGLDLRGSLRETPGNRVVPSPREQFETLAELLYEATGEVGRLRGQVAELRRDNQRLDRKRRKHKRRAAQLRARLDE